MNTINFRPTDSNNFNDAAYQFIGQRERSFTGQDLVPRDIGDGHVTIGAGLNLDGGDKSVKYATYRALGIRVVLGNDGIPTGQVDSNVGTSAQQTVEQGYVDRLDNILKNSTLTASQKAAALQLVMADRAADSALDGYADNRSPVFAFAAGGAGEQQIRQSFNEAILAYDLKIQKTLDTYDPTIITRPNYENSWEHAVLLSITWNGGVGLIGDGLKNAISTGNRAEAWFQIRYNTNGGQSRTDFGQGIANRRYAESNQFGLYDDPTTLTEDQQLAELKNVLRTLNEHAAKIAQEESTFPPASNEDLVANRIQPARDYLIAKYVTKYDITIDINGDILVGNDNSIMGATIGGQDNLMGKDTLSNTSPWLSNDLVLGEGGNDTLGGGAGDDVIYGGAGIDTVSGGDGNDVLVGGTEQDTMIGGIGNDILHGDDGAGGDILEGGAGNDTYYADNGDTIRDSDGQGTIYLNGKKLSFATRKKGESIWTDASGNAFTLNGTTLQINDPLTVEGFSNGQLGIYLDEQDDPGKPLPYDPDASVRRWDPLVLDLNGNGLIDAVASTGSTTYFDFNGDGISEKTGWVAAQDGILALDANNNGAIDNLSELFGSATQDGFTELASLDTNQDGTIDVQDTDYSQLRVWQDSNQNGIAQSGELHTLADLNITAINLATTAANLPAADNLITATGSFTRNGQTELAADIHLTVNFAQTDSNPNRPLDQAPTLSSDIFELPWLRGYGFVKSLHVAYQENPSLKQAAKNLIAQGRDSILTHFDGFLAQWSGLAAAHAAHGVTRSTLSTEDKVWMLETFTGQDVRKSAIEAANFGAIRPGTRQTWDTNYIDTQYQSFANREAINFALQATTKDWIKGAYYSLAGDRFVVTDAAMLQESLVQGLSAISNKQDALFAAALLDRLSSGGGDLAATLKPALDALPDAQMYKAAIDGRFAIQMFAGAFSAPDSRDWWAIGSGGNDWLYGNGGNDILDGGAGNDSLQGGKGNDTYVFGRGSGQDTVIDYDATAGNLDKVQIASGVLLADVKVTRDQSHLYLSISNPDGTTDKLTLQNWFSENAYKVEQVVFADDPAIVWDVAALTTMADTPTEGAVGGAGEDTLLVKGGNYLDGGEGRDAYVFDSGFGVSHIADSGTGGNNVQFNFNLADSGITIGLGSLKLSFANGDELHIDNFNANDPLNSYSINAIDALRAAVGLSDTAVLGDITNV